MANTQTPDSVNKNISLILNWTRYHQMLAVAAASTNASNITTRTTILPSIPTFYTAPMISTTNDGSVAGAQIFLLINVTCGAVTRTATPVTKLTWPEAPIGRPE
jgi:hypothetical protein